jgi:hypothetical protein
MRAAVVVDLTEGHLVGVEKLGLVFSLFLSAVTIAVGAATRPDPERDLGWLIVLVDVRSLTVVAAGGAVLRPDAGGSGSADEASRASIARPLAGALPVRQESAELTVLKAIEEMIKP